MKEIRLDNTSKTDFHQFMLGAVIPRPIALVSSIDKNGIQNLAPFSYFNAVSSIPPILMFSLSQKASDGSKKDTLKNIEQTAEFTVNMISHSVAWQMALSSVQFPPEVDEFEKTGFTAIGSKYVSAPRVKECLLHFECSLREIKEMGEGPGVCTLVFGDVLCIHADESLIDENNRLIPQKMDLIGRLGRNYYTRIHPENIFNMYQPMNILPIGYDGLPEHIRKSEILSGNEIARLAGFRAIYDADSLEKPAVTLEKKYWNTRELHLALKEALSNDQEELALLLLYHHQTGF